MAKTRSQTGAITIKKEEEEDRKPTHILNCVSNTAQKRDKITKREPSENNNISLHSQQVKVEEDPDTKALLKSTSNHSKRTAASKVSPEQINQLIDYVVNDRMSAYTASYKANMSIGTAYYYYNLYKNDPKKRITSLRNRHRVYTQEHIENLIRYIVDDKMPVPKASAKANMTCDSGRYYYNKYLKDPDHAIPILRLYQRCTKEQKNQLISYIVNDKMTIKKASKKAKMGATAGYYYYREYFNVLNPDIATPNHIATCARYTQEQKKELIGYISNDRMSITAAAKKANVGESAAKRHYRQYFKDPSNDVPKPSHIATRKRHTQKQISKVISYIVNDNMSIRAASRKANINHASATKHYRQYLKNHNMDIPCAKKQYTQHTR